MDLAFLLVLGAASQLEQLNALATVARKLRRHGVRIRPAGAHRAMSSRNFASGGVMSCSRLCCSVAFVGSDYLTVHMVEFGYDGPIEIEGSPDYAAWNRETMAR
ncbi:MAG TPA: hypothetical protein VNZ50_18885 [Hyphomicrobiaceae bacterium]|nr:hypothetical protein [Hyphomicrobiaceae bacterium]